MTKLFRTVPFVLLTLNAPNTGGGSGGSTETLEQKLTRVSSELNAANELLATANNDIVRLNTERAALQADIGNVTSQLATAKSELTAATTQVTTLTAQLTASKASGEKAAKEVTFLEQFCAEKGFNLAGVDRTKAVAEVIKETEGQDGDALIAQYEKLTNGTERTEFYRKNKAAIDSAYALRAVAKK